jgi:hypothetical protein
MDREAPDYFHNLMSPFKQPFLRKVNNPGWEANLGPTYTSFYKIYSENAFVVDINGYAKWEPTQVVHTLTVITRIEISFMPLDKSPLIELEIQGRGVVGLAINNSGVLSCFSRGNSEPFGSMISTDLPQITLQFNTPIYVRFTYSRSDVTSITSSCVIETSEGNITGALIPGTF